MSALEWLGWAGTVLVIIAYAQPDARRLRVVSLVASVALIGFNLGLGIWSNVALEVVLVAVNLVRLRTSASSVPEPASELNSGAMMSTVSRSCCLGEADTLIGASDRP